MVLNSQQSVAVIAPASVVPLPGARRDRIAIGVLIDAAVQEGWVLASVRQALAVPGAILCAVAIVRRQLDKGIAARLHSAVDALDRTLRCQKDELIVPVDVTSALGGPAPLQIVARQHGRSWTLDDRGAAALRDAGADVWLSFCAQPPQVPFPAVCAMGVWGLEIGAQVAAGNAWAGAAEVGAGTDMTVTEVVDYTRPDRDVVYRACGATVKNSACRNRLLALRKGLGIYGRLLRAVRHAAPRTNIPARLPDGLLPAARTAPTIPAVLGLCWRLASRVLSNRWRASAMRTQWRIGYYYADESVSAATPAQDLRTLVPPKDHDWADPFIVAHEGRRFIFFEDLPYRVGKAHISAVEVFANGEVGAAQTVLERPYHLSYPFVFAWEGQLYMVPETAENGTVELYRCEQFPQRWNLCKVLLENVRAFDSTLLREGGRWWLFANVAEAGAAPSEELFLYWSHSLLGPWTPHRANPVLSDVRQARGAGPVFRRGGQLYRPSQDCAADYGSAVSINRIDVLDTAGYRETPVERIEPDRKSGMRCLHTFGVEGRLRVVDFVVRQPRWSNA